MNKKGALLLVLLLSFTAGCGKKKQKTGKQAEKAISTQVDIPVADGNMKSFFNEELGEFNLADVETGSDFAWEEQGKGQFKVVYFDFDRYIIRQDQKPAVDENVEKLKEKLKLAKKDGRDAQIVVEGHACHSAGTAHYNLALSEKRAKTLKDALIAQGIDASDIKIVGRGQEIPAMAKGKSVTGSCEEQWPNRRDEISIIS